ncbi:MAG: hypothetical protein JW818_17195 [Pirellulales bacterium]|nr:hypothetical protein [Pirellulales bacterium]
MKRLLLLTAVTVMMAGTTGCRCWDWLCRGAGYPPAAQTVVVPDSGCGNTCNLPVNACGQVLPEPAAYGQPGS